MSHKTLSSRFMLVENRRSAHIGILEEIPQEGANERRFGVIWEIRTGIENVVLPREFTPTELLAGVIPANLNAERFFIGLLKGSWWIENEYERRALRQDGGDRAVSADPVSGESDHPDRSLEVEEAEEAARNNKGRDR